ncbi:division/cell wall cluster transcriptional repressor MraZ [bacterium]|nr:division/cell wall cluster transcriptional repressor MraZ [bacterium]
MFVGTFEHSIDPKNRITLPASWRKKLGEKVFLSFSADNCIELRTTEAFILYADTLKKLDSKKESVRKINRTFFANSSEIEIDGSNRILIPTSLINLAKIKKTVVMLGTGDMIEIWDQDVYNTDKRLSDVQDLSKELESLSSNDQ